MFTYQIAPGTTDVSVVLRVIDSADGTPETGVDHATTGIDLEYRREGEASTDITEAALAALTTAHTDGGVEQIGNGYIRVDLPDAACAAGVSGVLVHGTITGMVVIGCYIQLQGAVNKIYSDTTIVTSKTTQIYSDTTIIYSDTTIATSKTTQIYSDTTIAVSKAVQIYSDTTIATSKTTQIYSDTTAIHTQTTTASSKAVQIYSDTTKIHSDTTYLTGPGDGTAGVFPEWGIIDQGVAQAYTHATPSLTLRSAAAFGTNTLTSCFAFIHGSDQGYWQVASIASSSGDVATLSAALVVEATGTINYKIFGTPPSAGGALSVGQDSKLTRINSKSTQIYSDTTAIEAAGGALSGAQDSRLTKATSKTVQIYSDTTIVTSKTTQLYSDTTAIHTQTTTASSKVVQIYSDTTKIHSDTTALETGVNVSRINTVTITGDGSGTPFDV